MGGAAPAEWGGGEIARTLSGGPVVQISDNQDSVEMDPQEHSVTRTIDEEAELEERADREREEGHQEQDEEEEDRDHEVLTAGSEGPLCHIRCWEKKSPSGLLKCLHSVVEVFF